jgi:hypothetical protein
MTGSTNGVCDPKDLMLDHDHPPVTPPSQFDKPPPRFALGAEVFILDSNGTDPTGLTTYVVLSNHEKAGAGHFLYRLMPSQEVVFRAAETRLLEVNFPMGAQVKRKNDTLCSVITRRYVVNGERVYDLRDELGRYGKGIKEKELSLSDQGKFPFVIQME